MTGGFFYILNTSLSEDLVKTEGLGLIGEDRAMLESNLSAEKVTEV